MYDWIIIFVLGGLVIYWCLRGKKQRCNSGCNNCPLACDHGKSNNLSKEG